MDGINLGGLGSSAIVLGIYEVLRNEDVFDK
jgi:hypothetical protein